jgi:O-6-methylguanine DNA methyltransferase
MFYTILDFPKGSIFLAKSGKGLSFAEFMKSRLDLRRVTEFFRERNIPLLEDKVKFQLEEKLFRQYFEGREVDFKALSLDLLTGTAFQRKVWLETRKIPYGKTETYKSLARKLHHRGYRSIGQALSRNPLLIVIPCHRVLSSDGGLGGFSAGLKLKKYLLDLERGKA